MKIILLILAVVMTIFTSSTKVHAHVLLRDAQSNIGAVVHINPYDDPVAGSEAEFFFDIQDADAIARIPYSGYKLFISGDQGSINEVPLLVSNSGVSAEYVFPTQGVYKLELRSDTRYDDVARISMTYNLRISRGININNVSAASSTVSEYLTTFSAVAFIMLMIMAFNNRKNILEYSKF